MELEEEHAEGEADRLEAPFEKGSTERVERTERRAEEGVAGCAYEEERRGRGHSVVRESGSSEDGERGGGHVRAFRVEPIEVAPLKLHHL